MSWSPALAAPVPHHPRLDMAAKAAEVPASGEVALCSCMQWHGVEASAMADGHVYAHGPSSVCSALQPSLLLPRQLAAWRRQPLPPLQTWGRWRTPYRPLAPPPLAPPPAPRRRPRSVQAGLRLPAAAQAAARRPLPRPMMRSRPLRPAGRATQAPRWVGGEPAALLASSGRLPALPVIPSSQHIPASAPWLLEINDWDVLCALLCGCCRRRRSWWPA